MADHNQFANLIWQIADLLRGPYRPPQYERVMLPMTVLRRFDCVLTPTKAKVLTEHAKRKGGKLEGAALDTKLNEAAGQRFHNHSPLDFEMLKGDPDNIEKPRTRCRTSRWGSSSKTSSGALTSWPTRPRATTSRRVR